MHDFCDFEDLKPGMRLNIEGIYAQGTWCVQQISLKQDGEADELEGAVQAVDAPSGTLVVLGLRLHAALGAEILDAAKQPSDLAAIAPGARLKVKGRLVAPGRFEAAKIKIKPPCLEACDEIEGTITTLDAGRRCLTVLGFEIVCDEELEIEA